MENLTLEQLTDKILEQAQKKGFGTKKNEIDVMEKIALIHSEISEAMEAYRYKNINKKDGMAEELADAMIRIIHLAGCYDINLEKEILKKMKYNEERKWDWDGMNEKGKLNK